MTNLVRTLSSGHLTKEKEKDANLSGQQKKENLQKSGKIPGYKPSGFIHNKNGNLNNPSNLVNNIIVEKAKIFNKLSQKEIKQLFSGSGSGGGGNDVDNTSGINYPAYLDFSPNYFQLEEDDFLAQCPNIFKEIDLSGNAFVECTHLSHFTKLKRLSLDNNLLKNLSLKGLNSLEYLSLAQNRLDSIPDLIDLKKLVYLDLSGNTIKFGFHELIKLKNIKVIDLGNNGLEMPINEFFTHILSPLKKLPKLEMLNFYSNPIQAKIKQFAYFIINELPKLKYLDWDVISKEERTKASKLESEGIWDDHLLPVKSIEPSPNAPQFDHTQASGSKFNQTRTQPSGITAFVVEDSPEASQGQGRDKTARMLQLLLEDENENDSNKTKKRSSKGASGIKFDEATHVNTSSSTSRTLSAKSLLDPLDDILNQLLKSTPDASALDQIPSRPGTLKKEPQGRNRSATISVEDSALTLHLPPMPKPMDNILSPIPKHLTSSDPMEDDFLLQLNIAISTKEPGPSGGKFTDDDTGYLDVLGEVVKKRSDHIPNRQRELQIESELKAIKAAQRSQLTKDVQSKKENRIQSILLTLPTSSSHSATTPASVQQGLSYLELLDEVLQDHAEDIQQQIAQSKQAAGSSVKMQSEEAAQQGKKHQQIVQQIQSHMRAIDDTDPDLGNEIDEDDVTEQPDLSRKLSFSNMSHGNELQLNQFIVSQHQRLEKLIQEILSQKEEDNIYEFDWECGAKQIRLRDKIGSGSFGEVFKGVWRGNEVIFKKFYAIPTFSATVTSEYLRTEVQKMKSSAGQHQNIVPLLGLCADPQLHVVISDYVRGLPLYGLIFNPSLGLDAELIIKISLGICSGMAFLHHNGIIHRDLKPKNIILDPDFVPRIRDYGFCDVKDLHTLLSLKSIGHDTSDIEYLAPELYKTEPFHASNENRKSYDERVDMYSFAIILWQMFTREAPYVSSGMTPRQIAAAVVAGQRPPIPKSAPYVFRKLMRAGWNKESSQRPTFSLAHRILSQSSSLLKSFSTETEEPEPIEVIEQEPEPVQEVEQVSTNVEQPKQPTPIKLDDAVDARLQNVINKIKELLFTPSDLAAVNGCRAIMTLAQVQAQVPIITRFGLVQDLIQLLGSQFDIVQEAAVEALSSVADNDEACEIIRSEEGLIHLVALIQTQTQSQSQSDSLLFAVAKLVTKLAKKDENKKSIKEIGGLIPLIALLKNPNELIQIQTCWALSYLLQTDYNQNDFILGGGLSPLLNLMLSPNVALHAQVLDCLSYLVKNGWFVSTALTFPTEKAQDRILRSGVISRVFDVLTFNDIPLLQQLGLKLLVDFASTARGVEEILNNAGLGTLLGLVSSSSFALNNSQPPETLLRNLTPPEQSLYLTLKILTSITVDIAPKHSEAFRHLNGLYIVLHHVNAANHHMLLIQVMLLLANILEDAASRETFRLIGGANRLSLILSAAGVATLEQFQPRPALDAIIAAALSAFDPVAFDESNWDTLITECMASIEYIVSLLNSSNELIKRKAIKIISELARDDAVKEIIAAKDEVSTIVNMLLSPDPDTQESAVYCVSYLTDTVEDKQAVSDAGALGLLLPIFEAGLSPTIVERSLWAIANFAVDAFNQEFIIKRSLHVIAKQLLSPDLTIQSYAIKVILILSQNVANKKSLVEGGILPVLQQLSLPSNPNKNIQLIAAKVSNLLLQ